MEEAEGSDYRLHGELKVQKYSLIILEIGTNTIGNEVSPLIRDRIIQLHEDLVLGHAIREVILGEQVIVFVLRFGVQVHVIDQKLLVLLLRDELLREELGTLVSSKVPTRHLFEHSDHLRLIRCLAVIANAHARDFFGIHGTNISVTLRDDYVDLIECLIVLLLRLP